MTPHIGDSMDDSTRAFLRELFRPLEDEPPPDIVPSRGLTLEALRAQSDAADTYRTITRPGEVLLDADGIPAGVGPTTTERVSPGPVVISRNQMQALGLTAEDIERDYPGVHVAPDYTKETDK